MLIQFRVRNYKCFRDEQVLSLVASSDKSLPENVIFSPAGTKLNLLRSAVIYGANASGKTSLLDALGFVWMFVRQSAEKPGDIIPVLPFLLDGATLEQPSEFELAFIHKGIRYQYGFAATQQRVWAESLYYWPKNRHATLYERLWNPETEMEEFYFGPSLKGQNERIRQLTRPDALFLSVAAAFNHPRLSGIYDWFRNQLRGVQMPWFQRRPVEVEPDDGQHERYRKLLRLADLGIDDYAVELTAEEQEMDKSGKAERVDQATKGTPKRHIRINMLHRTADMGLVALPLALESNGTDNLFRLGEPLFEVLDQGSILFVDELDASLHPLLVRALIELFHNSDSNPHNAQLIFNTHDTTLLDQSLFRRDQIWFAEKKTDGAAGLYPLSNYSPRTDESISRGYMLGRYGAIPFIDGSSLLHSEEYCNEPE